MRYSCGVSDMANIAAGKGAFRALETIFKDKIYVCVKTCLIFYKFKTNIFLFVVILCKYSVVSCGFHLILSPFCMQCHKEQIIPTDCLCIVSSITIPVSIKLRRYFVQVWRQCNY